MCRSSFNRRALLLPKLRSHFAEFLQHGSLLRLSLLNLLTSVGFGTVIFLKFFPESFFKFKIYPINFKIKNSFVALNYTFFCFLGKNLKFPIKVGFRLTFRGRLTPHRATVCGNPSIYGDSEFNRISRYLCQHSHFWYLQLNFTIRLQWFTERSATWLI